MSRLLLDTHALLWWLDDAPALSAPARARSPIPAASRIDRLLVSQALGERIPIVTRNPRFAAYGVEIRW